MPSRGPVATADQAGARPPARRARVSSRPRPADRPEASAHGDADAATDIDLADVLASRRCAAKVASALKKLGYGFALIPATAKPKRSSKKD
jgi:hypothetical protein